MCEVLNESFNGVSARAQRAEKLVDDIKYLLKHREIRKGRAKFCKQLLLCIAELEREL